MYTSNSLNYKYLVHPTIQGWKSNISIDVSLSLMLATTEKSEKKVRLCAQVCKQYDAL